MPALSAQMRDATSTFASRINEGEYAALSVDGRTDLRGLSLQMASWADRVETMEGSLHALAQREPWRRRVPWLLLQGVSEAIGMGLVLLIATLAYRHFG